MSSVLFLVIILMKNRLFAGIMLAANLTSVASCTKPAPVNPEPTATGTTEAPVTQAPVSAEAPVATETSAVAPAVESVTKTETMTYQSPAGEDKVIFSLTHKSGVVESISVTSATDHEFSKNWQAKFAEAIPGVIV